jgi:hypothetical protein
MFKAAICLTISHSFGFCDSTNWALLRAVWGRCWSGMQLCIVNRLRIWFISHERITAIPRTVAPLAEPSAPISDETNAAIAAWI